MPMNYPAMQVKVISILKNLGAIPVTIANPIDGTVQKTIGLFDEGVVENVDIGVGFLKNPTPIAGQTKQFLYVPGTLKTTPKVGHQVSYKDQFGAITKRVAAINTTQPASLVLVYALTLE